MFDHDHDMLLNAVEELHIGSDEALDSPWFLDWQQRYADLSATHFRNEETWMAKAGIPQSMCKTHADDHKRMLKEAQDFFRLKKLDWARTAGDLYKPLKVELLKHFVLFDAVLKQCARLNEKMSEPATAGGE